MLGETCRSGSTPTPGWSSRWVGPSRVVGTTPPAYRDSGLNQALARRAVPADGGYQGNAEVITPFRKPKGQDLSRKPATRDRLLAGCLSG